ncbi:MAG: FoF1 ATP synthase subunit delta [Candidatus Ornithomonoglobus sp.]
MMAQSAIDYARAAFELDSAALEFGEVEDLIKANPELFDMLCDPGIDTEEKREAIDRIFQDSVKEFLKLFLAETEKTLHAELVYCTAPSEEQLEAIKRKLLKLYNKQEVELTLTEDKSLIGGFLLRAAGSEFDYSIKSRLDGMSRKLCRR